MRGCNEARERELHYRPDLDGLRGIAILAVVAFHAFPAYVAGGFVGVDVFFVLSGFLISAIILRQLHSSTFSLTDFYLRRARRLFPALAVVLAACLLLGWFMLLPDELERLGRHVGAAAAFVLNFAVWREGGYFDPAAELNPVLHLWSLGIEEQFYLVWPLVLMLLGRHRKILLVTVAVMVAASFAINILFSHTDPRGDFYLPVTRFWELGLGCWLAIRENHGVHRDRAALIPQRFKSALPLLGVGLIVTTAIFFDSRMAFPGWLALLPAAGAMCVISGTPGTWMHRHILTSGPLVGVGIISYPLYLWHWPLLSFATIFGAGDVPPQIRAAAVVVSFMLAYLVFRFVESPIRRQPAPRSGRTLTAGLGILGVAGLSIYAASGVAARFGHDVRSLEPASRVNRYCPNSLADHFVFNYCKSTSPAAPEIVFLGDSRTQAVYDGMVSLTRRGFPSYPMMLLARGGCPPMLRVQADEGDRHRDSCDQTWSAFVSYVRELRPKVVVLVGGGSDELEFKKGLSDLIAALRPATKVIYIRETPAFDSGPACFLRPIKVPWGTCAPIQTRATVERHLAAYNRAVDEIAGTFPDLVVVDSIGALCGSTYCAQKLRSGEILYRDPLHLTAAGARHLDEGSGLAGAIRQELLAIQRE